MFGKKAITISVAVFFVIGFSPQLTLAYNDEEPNLINRLQDMGEPLARDARNNAISRGDPNPSKIYNWVISAYENLCNSIPDYLDNYSSRVYEEYGVTPTPNILISGLQSYLWVNLTLIDAEAWAWSTNLDALWEDVVEISDKIANMAIGEAIGMAAAGIISAFSYAKYSVLTHYILYEDAQMLVGGTTEIAGDFIDDIGEDLDSNWFRKWNFTVWENSNKQKVYEKDLEEGGIRDLVEAYAWNYINSHSPKSFDLVSPSDNSWTNDNTPEFTWQTSNDPEEGSLTGYELYIDGELNRSVGSEITSTTPISSLSEGTHTWHVVARSGVWATPSSEFTLRIDTVAPSAPTLLSPADDVLVI